jgi:hypothetical protein
MVRSLNSIDADGIIHQFFVDHTGVTHWAGSQNGPRGLVIDNTTKKRLEMIFKELYRR